MIYVYANNLAARGHQVTIVHPYRHWTDPPLRNSYQKLRHRAKIALNHICPPRFDWQPLDKRVRMLFVPSLAPEFFPDADAVFATVWGTAFDVHDLPSSKGEKFYLIQHYDSLVGSKEKVDETWQMPLHKVVVSEWLLNVGRDLGCRDIVHIPNAIDHTQFQVTTPIRARPRRIAFLYSPLDWKGAPEAVQALSIAKQRHPDIHAIFYGIARHRPNILPKWVDYFSNPPLSKLTGQILNGSSIFLSSSWYEGWPLGPAEAMACGCAVVTTNSRGVLDYCEHNVSALLSEPKKPQALAGNIIRLLENDELRIKIAVAGHERIQQFTWERSTNMLEAYISACVSRAHEDQHSSGV